MLEQRFERALGAELLKTEQIIPHTKFFDDIDKIYGVPNAEYTANSDGTPNAQISGSGISSGSSSSFEEASDLGVESDLGGGEENSLGGGVETVTK